VIGAVLGHEFRIIPDGTRVVPSGYLSYSTGRRILDFIYPGQSLVLAAWDERQWFAEELEKALSGQASSLVALDEGEKFRFIRNLFGGVGKGSERVKVYAFARKGITGKVILY